MYGAIISICVVITFCLRTTSSAMEESELLNEPLPVESDEGETEKTNNNAFSSLFHDRMAAHAHAIGHVDYRFAKPNLETCVPAESSGFSEKLENGPTLAWCQRTPADSSRHNATF